MEIQKFDVTTHIRNEVRKVLVKSIPKEAMDNMIRAEYDLFFKSEYARGKSPFAQLVADALKEQFSRKIKAWLDANFQQQFDEIGGQKLVGELVAELVPIVQQSIMTDITSRALADLRQRLTY